MKILKFISLIFLVIALYSCGNAKNDVQAEISPDNEISKKIASLDSSNCEDVIAVYEEIMNLYLEEIENSKEETTSEAYDKILDKYYNGLMKEFSDKVGDIDNIQMTEDCYLKLLEVEQNSSEKLAEILGTDAE